ncbi:MAG: protein tyrosine phosphatase [Candidatus Cloacimonetes bacterium]|jgi:tRNA threonylcarbamoyl adenosine modification protein (Sua5/YciO/YrdC/YwlC family)|nr:protein tyrosine phosphatase [Candidatus Cloacimonadota bacterium]MBT6994581.1 protein tyrosine phosphatase [Candidatus Cloacimonadota bacterium]MBT7470130.1 protein tyrosine phosphatase [Candidatus Cloacimonadota bacterium]
MKKIKITEVVNQPKDAIFLHYTGNMFGIGCSAFCQNAITKIDVFKNRQNKSGYIVLIPKIEWLEKYNAIISAKMKRIMQQFWPGNLTIILPTNDARFGLEKVAFRIPTDKFLRDFIEEFGEPIVSTSINRSGEDAMIDLQEIEKLDWFDFAILPKNEMKITQYPSTIIDDFFCIREGSIPFAQIERVYLKPQILFVCTGNICRSPMAEYLAKQLSQYRIKSAGFLESGNEISENSRLILKENGIDASKHLSTQISQKIIDETWLILTMTENHKKQLLTLSPNAIYKTFTLSEYTGFKGDIADPYKKDLATYRETFEAIKKRIEKIK